MAVVTVGDKVYEVEIADTEDLREHGLQGVDRLAPDKGMLFIFDEEDEQSFWMHNTLINLDIVFINDELEVVKVVTATANTEDAHTCDDCMYVLEVNEGSGIKVGDEVDFNDIVEDDDEESETVMSVLDEDGNSQMDLKGGERIFSRKNTRVLVKFAKRAWKTKNETDYKVLGRKLFKFLRVQDEKEDDYVDLPTK